MRKEIRSIKNQLHERTKGIEKPIDIVLIDKNLIELAAEININQSLQKENRLSILKREHQLKESISNISHDLRTPLTSMLGYLQLLQKTELSNEQKEYLDISLSRGKYLQALINNFYDISLLEDKEFTLTLERINLDNILADIILSFTNQFEERNITPSIKFSDKPTYVIADETMLKRLVMNLVSNVIRYGSKELLIEILYTDFIEVHFQNEIRNEKNIDTDRLFDKFYTADLSRNHSGSGLGLYIVKVLAEKMGGKVSAYMKKQNLVISLYLIKP
ncbi:sensor histidine kinase [Clostridioides sp. ES-S-0056-01]|nr:HAMP domain-containing histidine kinase [Clostridioides sp. ES-S-0056-01]